MASIPIYMRGRNLVTVTLTPQTVAANGGLTDGTPVALQAVIDGLELSLRATTEEISPLNTTRDNHMITSDGHEIRLSILKVNNASDPDPLNTAIGSADVFKVTVVEGTGTSQRTHVMYCTRGEFSMSFQGKGRQIASLQLFPVDAGSSSYART